MPASASERRTPRDRLLDAADQLFYEEGICTVGVDRILSQAGVARASLYTTYGSKERLICAYLQGRSDAWQAAVAELLPTRWDNPRDRILGVFTLLTEWFDTPGYRGCPFINASAEAASGLAVEEVRDRHRAWVRELFAKLGREAGARDPGELSTQLVLLYDGSMVGAQLDRTAAPGRTAQAVAAALLDTAIERHPAINSGDPA
ncbi:MAG TPA: TetR/AcrR family transcriptional regulator [Solirubrobacteraceae bacterium]